VIQEEKAEWQYRRKVNSDFHDLLLGCRTRYHSWAVASSYPKKSDDFTKRDTYATIIAVFPISSNICAMLTGRRCYWYFDAFLRNTVLNSLLFWSISDCYTISAGVTVIVLAYICCIEIRQFFLIRKCLIQIGQKFTLMEEKVVLIHILKSFAVESIQTLEEIEDTAELIIKPRNGIKLHLKPREMA
uniref:Uncharacterized protein n=1 Tax=Strigamia maritima TaxID=126957 RepID=T1IQT6_STRMM